VSERFGIWLIISHWGSENGGDDLVGTREEMEATAKEWRSHPASGWASYEAEPYVEVEKRQEQLAWERQRMKELEIQARLACKSYEDVGGLGDEFKHRMRVMNETLQKLTDLRGGKW